MPSLTIGVPAYNNARTLAQAVNSLLAQDHADLRVLISDDGSRDDTEAVGRALAAADSRVRYHRQPVNLRYANFGWLLDQTDTEFFMWAAGDDRWLPGFVSACLGELRAHPGLAGAVSRVAFEREGRPIGLASGTAALTGTPAANLRRFFAAPGDNSRMYGVFRTAIARRAFPPRTFHAWDWGFSSATLCEGGHAEIPAVLMVRDKTPSARYVEMVREDAGSRLDRLLPVGAMSRWLLSLPGFPREPSVRSALLALNLEKHLEYSARFHPGWARLARPVLGRAQTRLRA